MHEPVGRQHRTGARRESVTSQCGDAATGLLDDQRAAGDVPRLQIAFPEAVEPSRGDIAEIDGAAQVAAIYDPTRRELFTAERGEGSSLNGRPLRVSAAQTLVDAMLDTGFPYDVHGRIDEIVGLFGAFVGRARAVRRLGSAALDLCYVAAGRLDGFWESDLKPWDIAAGALIVAEAGGRVSDMNGAPFSSRGRHVLASNGIVHDAMLEVIRSHRLDSARRTGD